MEPTAVSCFPRGLISLNTSVSYLIEPLSAAGDEAQHAVFRAESLHLPGGSCLHYPGNTVHKEGLDDFIQGMMSPQPSRVSSERNGCLKRLFQKWHHMIYLNCFPFSEQKGSEPEYEICGTAVSGWQGRGEDQINDSKWRLGGRRNCETNIISMTRERLCDITHADYSSSLCPDENIHVWSVAGCHKLHLLYRLYK